MEGVRKANGKIIFRDAAAMNAYKAHKAAQVKARKAREAAATNANSASPLSIANGSQIEVNEDSLALAYRETVRTFNTWGRAVQSGNPMVAFDLFQKRLQINARQKADEEREVDRILREARVQHSSYVMTRNGLDERTEMRPLSRATIDSIKWQISNATMDEGTDTAGGTLLPKQFLAEVFVILEQYGRGRQLLRHIPMTSKTIDLKALATKPAVGFVDELGNIPATDVTFHADDEQLSVAKAGGVASWSTELEEDQAIALLPVLQSTWAEQIALFEDQLCFIADGTSTYKSMTGLLNFASGVVHMASTKTHFYDMTPDNMNALKYAVSQSSRQGAVYLVHPDNMSVIETFKASTSGIYQVQFPGDQQDVVTNLWGHKVIDTLALPAPGDTDVSTKFMVFGNPVHYLFGQRRGVSFRMSRDAVLTNGSGVVTRNAFQEDAVLIQFTERIGVGATSNMAPRFASLETAAA